MNKIKIDLRINIESRVGMDLNMNVKIMCGL